jgi:hypothetical protein
MRREVLWATIASGAALSAEVNTGGGEIVGIQMPAAWDTAGITFQALVREVREPLPVVSTFGNVLDATGTEVALSGAGIAANAYIAISAGVSARFFNGLGRIKIRSGTSGTPVNQTAQRLVGVVVLVSNE